MIDRVTRLMTGTAYVLLLGYPIRTSLGVCLGVGIKTLTQIFKPLISVPSAIIDISRVESWQYLAVGILILHVQTIRFYIRRKATLLGENEEKALEIIKKAKSEGVPDWRIQKMYIELCEKVLANTQLNQATREELKDYLQP